MPAKSFYGSPTKTFLEMPTTLLQVLRRAFGRLRESRRSPGIYFGVCGSPAGLPAFTLAFADTPASPPAFTLAFAGVPQVSRHLLWRLRGVPQVFRHLFWRLRESRKSPGICFDVCGESRKCFGEPVGRCSMLSMTFSIRESHSFVEFTLYNTDIKPYRANLYVKRTPYRPYTPSPT